jgi:curved DNA-binding protein
MGANGYRDYFKVLGVERSADADAIKRAFRKLARQYHPDVNPDDAGAEAKFKEVSEAYEVLSDPDKRRRYEQFGQYWSQAGGGPGTGGVDVDFGRYGNFDDFINDLLGRLVDPPPAVPRAVSVLVRASRVVFPAACLAVCLEGAAPLR